MSALFESNRNLYHTFSRVAIQEGQGVAAAVNKTGHTVTINDVWADVDKLPKNTTYFGNAGAAFTDLKAVYDADVNYAKYVKLYENVTLTPVSGSGQDAGKNQAWELLVDGKRVKNFVAPTDVFDADGQPCNGYTLHLYDAKGTEVAPTDGNWAFDYVAGLVIFERGKTPQDKVWPGSVALGETLTLTAWAYVGDVLSKTLTNIDKSIADAKTELNQGIADAKAEIATTINNLDKTLMAIKPFTWEANNETMQFVYKAVIGIEVGADITGKGYYELSGEEYALTEDAAAVEGKTYYQYLGKKIEIPAVVFNVFNASTGIAYGDITYLEGGKTEVFFEDWNDDMFGGEKTFVAYGFVLGNGNPINVLALGDLNVYSSSSSVE